MSESVSVGLLLNEPSESFGVCEWLIQCLWVTCHPPLCVYVCVFYLSGVCVIRSSRVLKRPVSSLCSRWLRWAWSLSASPCDWICVCACSSALSNKFSRLCDSYTHTRIHSYLTMWLSITAILYLLIQLNTIWWPHPYPPQERLLKIAALLQIPHSATLEILILHIIYLQIHTAGTKVDFIHSNENVCGVPHVKATVIIFGWLLC